MAQMERVSWRTVGYSMLGAAAIIAGTVGIVRSDGVRPTSLKSNSATRWLVYQPEHLLVLADGLTGKLLAKISTESTSLEQAAYQGAGGAFLVAPDEGSVRSVSTAKLSLGSTQKLAPLSEAVKDPAHLTMGVGPNGLTVVNTETDEASLVGTTDAPRPIDIPKSDTPFVARDGSIWLFDSKLAVHVSVDGSRHSYNLAGTRTLTATVGSHAVFVDAGTRTLHWIDGSTVDISAIPNLPDAIIQQPRGEDAPCVWLGSGSTLYCVGKQAIEHTATVPGLGLRPGDRLAVAGTVAVVIHAPENRVQRIDVTAKKLLGGPNPEPNANGPFTTMISVGGIVWIDDTAGHKAWSIHDLGFETIDKNSSAAPLLDAQGQVQDAGSSDGGDNSTGGGNVAGPDQQQRLCDDNGQDNSPITVDDQVTARAGNTIIIPVTANDYDPDCPQAIALYSVDTPGHGTADVLDGTSVSYVPEQGYSGTDRFTYTIVDETGLPATGTVNIDLFPADSPNQPPITKPDHATTSVGRAVIVDVLSNDIDPERDLLTIPNFSQPGEGTITDAQGPSGLPALKFTPPPDQSGRFVFTYQAADPEGATSTNTEVTVDVAPANAQNDPPTARPDSIRLKVGVSRPLNVMANDTDPDGDNLTITALQPPPGVTSVVQSGRLLITLLPDAQPRTVVRYTLSDGITGHDQIGRVLVLRIDDVAPNRPPVANPDSDRVVFGSSVKIAVIANDRDPDSDTVRLVSFDQPTGNLGTVTQEGDALRFTPTQAALDAGTVTFSYKIADGHNNTATGNVTVTVLAQALPKAPIATDDQAETYVDTPKTIDVLANDTDPSGGKPTLLPDVACNGGQAIVTAAQQVTYTPPSQGIDHYRCRYRVANTAERTAEASIFINVVARPPGNHPPTANQSALSRTVTIGASTTFTASQLATDEDGDTLTFTSVSKPSLGSTGFTQASAAFTYNTPTRKPTDTFPLIDNIDVQITDNQSVITEHISIVINDEPPTTPPSVAPRTRQIPWPAERESTTQIPVVDQLAADNTGVTLTLTSATAVVASQATVTFSDGVVSVTPHVSGPVTVNYTVQSSGGSSPGTILLSVVDPPPDNPAPVAVDDALTVSSGGTASRNLLTNDSGYDNPGDVLQVSLDDSVPASFGTLTLSSNGLLTLKANPTMSGGGQATIHYTLSDGHATDHASVTLLVDACTDSPPQAKPDPFLFTPYETPITIDLTQQVVSGSIDLSSIRGVITTVTGTYVPPAGENGVVQVLFDVVNGCHQVDHGKVTIDVNRAPTDLGRSFDVTPGQTLTLVPGQIAHDDETLVITGLIGQPDWVTLAADGSSISATPPPGATGVTFQATVSDPGLLTATANVTLNLSNLPPTANDDVYFTTDSLIVLSPPPTANDTDPEGQPLTIYSVTPRDTNGAVQNISGNSVTLTVAHGRSVFDYTIKDAGGLTASATITVTSNHAPTMADVSGETNQASLNVTLSPTDPDSDDLSHLDVACVPLTGWDVQLLKDPSPAIPDRVRAFIMVAPGTVPGIYTFPCTVTDPLGASATAIVSITIDPT